MKKIRCIDNNSILGGNVDWLKLNKIYDVLIEEQGNYLIVDEEGDKVWVIKDRFEVAEDGEDVVAEIRFNWQDFKNGHIAVNCDTKEKAIDFLKKCDERGIVWIEGQKTTKKTYWDLKKELTSYCCIYNKGKLGFARKDFYKEKGITLIEWEIKDKKEVKMDTNNNLKYEFSFEDIIRDSNEENEYENSSFIIKKANGLLHIIDRYNNGITVIDKNHKFALKKEEVNEYAFSEALELYEEGKEIESKVSKERYKKINGKDTIYDNTNKTWVDNDFEFTFKEIRGKWYIK